MTVPGNCLDLTGKRFGRLTVLRYTPERMDGRVVWECICDCGKPVKAISSRMISGTTRSCGCVRQDDMGREEIGAVYGRLTITSYAGESHWNCACLCGKSCVVMTSNLRSGKQKSCGCYRADVSRTHGKSNTSIYRRWSAMLDRCHNPLHASYHHYGARGIKVCQRWHTFENFYADMGDPPRGLSLDRVDVNKGYEPGNVRWADAHTQAMNKRDHKTVVIQNLSIDELEGILAVKKEAALGVFA